MKTALGVLGLLVIVACGRTEDAGGDPSGGSGGKPGVGGQGFGGANGGAGGKVSTGGGGNGGSATGGFAGKGGAPNTGGVPDEAGGEGGARGDSVPLEESSWNTTLALTITKSVGATLNCNSSNFVLHVSPSGPNLKTISGVNGAALVGELVGDAQSSPSYSVTQTWPVPAHGDCDLQSIAISQLVLRAADADGDGTADGIAGSGKASGTKILGDVGYTAELAFTLTGVPDTTRPSILAPTNLHPLDGVSLLATEPVAVNSSVTLTSTGTASATQLLSGYNAQDGALVRFSSSVVLPFGSSWQVNATGEDLASLPFDVAAVAPITVIADPGLFAQDGFESTPLLALTGAAKIVTSIGTTPAIAGSKSLFVPPDSVATVHLSRPSAASHIRFTVQGFTSTSGATVTASFAEAGVIGGKDRVRPTQPIANTPSTNTGDSGWPYAGPTQEVTLPLAESGSDVVIRFATPVCHGFCPPQQALLIDDLRVE